MHLVCTLLNEFFACRSRTESTLDCGHGVLQTWSTSDLEEVPHVFSEKQKKKYFGNCLGQTGYVPGTTSFVLARLPLSHISGGNPDFALELMGWNFCSLALSSTVFNTVQPKKVLKKLLKICLDRVFLREAFRYVQAEIGTVSHHWFGDTRFLTMRRQGCCLRLLEYLTVIHFPARLDTE